MRDGAGRPTNERPATSRKSVTHLEGTEWKTILAGLLPLAFSNRLCLLNTLVRGGGYPGQTNEANGLFRLFSHCTGKVESQVFTDSRVPQYSLIGFSVSSSLSRGSRCRRESVVPATEGDCD